MIRWIIAMVLVIAAASGCSSESAESAASTRPSQPANSPSSAITGTPSPTESAAVSATPAAADSSPYAVAGKVLAYGQPVVSARVSLYAAQAQPGGSVAPMATGTTDAAGGFTLTASVAALDNLYLLTSGGLTLMRPGELSPTVVLGSLLGTARPANVVVNELTTVAGAFAASEYFVGESVVGPNEVIAESADTAAGLADPVTGAPGASASGNADQLIMLNTLGNALSSCVWNEPRCAAIVAPNGREPATTTWSGMAATARDPWDVGPIFAIQQGYTAFSPVFQEPPTSGWVLLP